MVSSIDMVPPVHRMSDPAPAPAHGFSGDPAMPFPGPAQASLVGDVVAHWTAAREGQCRRATLPLHRNSLRFLVFSAETAE